MMALLLPSGSEPKSSTPLPEVRRAPVTGFTVKGEFNVAPLRLTVPAGAETVPRLVKPLMMVIVCPTVSAVMIPWLITESYE